MSYGWVTQLWWWVCGYQRNTRVDQSSLFAIFLYFPNFWLNIAVYFSFESISSIDKFHGKKPASTIPSSENLDRIIQQEDRQTKLQDRELKSFRRELVLLKSHDNHMYHPHSAWKYKLTRFIMKTINRLWNFFSPNFLNQLLNCWNLFRLRILGHLSLYLTTPSPMMPRRPMPEVSDCVVYRDK